jgi:predicted O-methyltransferase YrrM
MATHSDTAPYQGAPDPSRIQSQLVPELSMAARRLRGAAAPLTPADRENTLREISAQLSALCDYWAHASLGLGHVLQALRHQSEKISQLRQSDLSAPDFATKAYLTYLGLENIPSQITAAFEQACIDNGTAPARHKLLNEILRLRKGTSYLEIGCCNNDCFDAVRCSQKVGVDPQSGGTLRMTSDAFFAVNQQTFDLIFIDGLHEATQVDKDIMNALRWSSERGVIVLHDCNPLFEIRTIVPRIAETWNGDVWKSLVRARSKPDLDCATGLLDHGCAVICKRPNSAPIQPIAEDSLSWLNLEANREKWLRTMSYDQLIAWIGG